MTKNYKATLRVAGISTEDLAAIDAHIRRLKEQAENVNSDLSHLNQELYSAKPKQSLFENVAEFSKDYPHAKKGGVAATEFVLTASQDYFDSISPGWREGKFTPEFEQWKTACISFMTEKYGSSVMNITLHLDEGAPHLHAIIVPLALTKTKNRFGEKEALKISHYAHFGNTGKELALSRKNLDSESTKLGALQTEFAAHLQRHGVALERGEKNSRAKNMQPKEFRAIVDGIHKVYAMPDKPKPLALPGDKPGMFASKEDKAAYEKRQAAYDKALPAYREAMRAYNAQTLAILENQRSLLVERETDKIKMKRLESKMAAQDVLLTQLKTELAKAADLVQYKDLDDIVKKNLRTTPLAEVAVLLGYDEDRPLNPKWKNNPIDMILDIVGKDAQGKDLFTPAQAFEWLNIAIGRRDAGVLMVQAAETAVKAPAPVLPRDMARIAMVTEQLNALQQAAKTHPNTPINPHAPEPDLLFTVTVQREASEGRKGFTRVYGGTADDNVKLNAQQVIDMVPKLSRENSNGANIFITPYSHSDVFFLLDDCRMDKATGVNRFAKLSASKIPFNYSIESSPDNKQIVFKANREDLFYSLKNTILNLPGTTQHPTITPEMRANIAAEFEGYSAKATANRTKLLNVIFTNLNKAFGDPGIRGQTHAFRLAGFENRKEQHKIDFGFRPVCQIIKHEFNPAVNPELPAQVNSPGSVHLLRLANDYIVKFIDNYAEARKEMTDTQFEKTMADPRMSAGDDEHIPDLLVERLMSYAIPFIARGKRDYKSIDGLPDLSTIDYNLCLNVAAKFLGKYSEAAKTEILTDLLLAASDGLGITRHHQTAAILNQYLTKTVTSALAVADINRVAPPPTSRDLYGIKK